MHMTLLLMLAGAAVLLAFLMRDQSRPRRFFCLFWALVTAGWAGYDHFFGEWIVANSRYLDDSEHSLATLTYYIFAANLNGWLAYFAFRHCRGYTALSAILLFWALLPLAVAIQARTAGAGDSLWYWFNGPLFHVSAAIEVSLLMVSDDGIYSRAGGALRRVVVKPLGRYARTVGAVVKRGVFDLASRAGGKKSCI